MEVRSWFSVPVSSLILRKAEDMEQSFQYREHTCEQVFSSLEPVFHICSQEDYEIIFSCREDYVAGMGILGIVCKLFPEIHLYTFQLMSNHFHLVIGGNERDIQEYLKLFKLRLQKYFEKKGRFVPICKMKFTLFPVGSLDYFRAAVAYVNRNGFVADGSYSPYSYPWGANTSFFNRILGHYYVKCRVNVPVQGIRSLFHSKMGDGIKDLYMLDGCVAPLSFCSIDQAERTFRDERHYFYCVSRNVESYGAIAKETGERISYTDEDIFQIVSKKSFELCGSRMPSLLDSSSKMELARQLHYDYNASNKQIQRMLKIDASVLNSLF